MRATAALKDVKASSLQELMELEKVSAALDQAYLDHPAIGPSARSRVGVRRCRRG